MSALGDLVEALNKAAEAFEDAAGSVAAADEAADTSVELAELAGLEGGVAMLKDGQDDLAGLLTQLAEGQSALESFKNRAQALMDDL